ncbi:PP2C family protein-serine/threonine phosphatase [Avibacterium paragallinarum]|uniref:Phosphoprotein phosphatase n=1 Tax=Avibacterium paragallinarum TaxID=728 RepID=A0AAE5TJT5_AVIPA|nr:protein phosphatase 2C domain-containing protein [Avibacterium paragallinarum]MEE3608331.1 protein phosphatase 2C domain-containing protein [Avibacterium paragallinarum]MEE3621381.1 protein phosphatase 2C domain-containing protein [Avibacterium paragallinarum]MEE3668047.1 protein phosphatase 2C domain-containing protein [Avibacterium paragallinarum]MEE3681174.1 protein phosphatase 2C domain-containing protein [Avibacterium paragallinarum]MEE4386368.1 protein phosphatase 2C domain-containing
MPFQLTFCQQAGNDKKHNQDALFNGVNVYQWKLKNAENVILYEDTVIFGIADGVSNSPKPQLASRFLMEQLSQCQLLSSAWLRDIQNKLSERYAQSYFGTSSTFVGCELYADGSGKIVNTGDSRAYKITINGEWQQLSFDHTILAEMQAQGLADEQTEYAAMYQGLSDCISANFDEADFRIHIATFQLAKGESILLCSDGLHNYITPIQIKQIWQKYPNSIERLQICRKMVKKHRTYDDFSVILCEFL